MQICNKEEMQLNELISILQEIKKEHGNLFINGYCGGDLSYGISISIEGYKDENNKIIPEIEIGGFD